jgi:hypothetical protein
MSCEIHGNQPFDSKYIQKSMPTEGRTNIMTPGDYIFLHNWKVQSNSIFGRNYKNAAARGLPLSAEQNAHYSNNKLKHRSSMMIRQRIFVKLFKLEVIRCISF